MEKIPVSLPPDVSYKELGSDTENPEYPCIDRPYLNKRDIRERVGKSAIRMPRNVGVQKNASVLDNMMMTLMMEICYHLIGVSDKPTEDKFFYMMFLPGRV